MKISPKAPPSETTNGTWESQNTENFYIQYSPPQKKIWGHKFY